MYQIVNLFFKCKNIPEIATVCVCVRARVRARTLAGTGVGQGSPNTRINGYNISWGLLGNTHTPFDSLISLQGST